MGIDLGDVVVKRPTSMAAWSGQRVAFDAWNILYQFLTTIRQPDGTPLMDKEGRITSHLAGVLYRTSNLVEAGIKPIFVFDGQPHVLKQETLARRNARRDEAQREQAEALAAGDTQRAFTKAQQASRLTPPMAQQAERLLRALGVPVVQAPGEGEAQAAWMNQHGHADAVCSQDYDALLFGARSLIRNLTVTGRRKLPGKQVWIEVEPEEVPLAASLAGLGLSREQLVDVALLVGTDFHPGVHGIGPKKAVALVKRHGTLEALLDRLAADPASAQGAAEKQILEQHEALAERDAVRRIFLEPAHTDAPAPQPTRPDVEAVLALMVDEHGFSKERVESALLKFGAARSKGQQQSLFDF